MVIIMNKVKQEIESIFETQSMVLQNYERSLSFWKILRRLQYIENSKNESSESSSEIIVLLWIFSKWSISKIQENFIAQNLEAWTNHIPGISPGKIRYDNIKERENLPKIFMDYESQNGGFFERSLYEERFVSRDLIWPREYIIEIL